MKSLVNILIALSVALWFLILYFREPNSTIAITWSTFPEPIRVKTIAFSAFILVAFIVGYLFFRFLDVLWRLPKTMADRRTRKTWVKGAKGLHSALIQLIEGNYAKAEKLTSGTFPDEEALIHHWIGARAAAALGRDSLRDKHVEEAIATNANTELAMRTEQVRLMLDASEYDRALEVLENPVLAAAHHLRFDAMLGASRWREAMDALNKSFAAKQVDKPTFISDAQCFAREDFESLGDAEALRSYYQGLHKLLRKDPEITNDYLVALCAKQPGEVGLTEIEKALKAQASPTLLDAYAAMDIDPKRKLDTLAILADKNRLNHHVVDTYLRALAENNSPELQSELERAANQSNPSEYAIKTLISRHIKAGENEEVIALMQRLDWKN